MEQWIARVVVTITVHVSYVSKFKTVLGPIFRWGAYISGVLKGFYRGGTGA
jgi:hypothetical protein